MCQQPATMSGYCSYHDMAARSEHFRHDRFYHRKVVLGEVQPTHDYISDVELDALFSGRRRNDGRRLDVWTR